MQTCFGMDLHQIVDVSDVKKVVYNLKANKSDGNFDLSTDDFLNADDDLYVHIALLFSTILVHGFSHTAFSTSTIIPIAKGNNVNMTDSAQLSALFMSRFLTM